MAGAPLGGAGGFGGAGGGAAAGGGGGAGRGGGGGGGAARGAAAAAEVPREGEAAAVGEAPREEAVAAVGAPHEAAEAGVPHAEEEVAEARAAGAALRRVAPVAAAELPLAGGLGFPSGPSSSLACAMTSGAVCACDGAAINCIAVSAVVASRTSRRFVMMVLIPGRFLAADLATNVGRSTNRR